MRAGGKKGKIFLQVKISSYTVPQLHILTTVSQPLLDFHDMHRTEEIPQSILYNCFVTLRINTITNQSYIHCVPGFYSQSLHHDQVES